MTTRSSPYRTTSCSTISVRAQSRTACWLWGLRRDITESTSPPFTTSQYESLLPLPLRAAFLMSPQTSNSKRRFLVHDLALPLRHFSSFPKVQKLPGLGLVVYLFVIVTHHRAPLFLCLYQPKRSIIFSLASLPLQAPPFPSRGQDQKHGIAAPSPIYTSIFTAEYGRCDATHLPYMALILDDRWDLVGRLLFILLFPFPRPHLQHHTFPLWTLFPSRFFIPNPFLLFSSRRRAERPSLTPSLSPVRPLSHFCLFFFSHHDVSPFPRSCLILDRLSHHFIPFIPLARLDLLVFLPSSFSSFSCPARRLATVRGRLSVPLSCSYLSQHH